LRREFLDGKVFDSIEDAQARLNVWVELPKSLLQWKSDRVDLDEAEREPGDVADLGPSG
jgi:hypothetical protein